MIHDFKGETAHMRRMSIREAHFSAFFISTVTMMSALVLSRAQSRIRRGISGI